MPMPYPLASPAVSGLIYAFQQSDWFSWLIYIVLTFFSIVAWTIMIDKLISVRQALRRGEEFQRRFAETRSPGDMLLQLDKYGGCPMAQVYEAGIEEMAEIMDLTADDLERCARSHTLPRALSTNEVDRVRSTLERNVSVRVGELESRLGWLGTAVTLSPFLGLLGTVWGVMMAFCGMAQAGKPDIGALAPGVSGALLTTVVGLWVAIPSLVGYNAITTTVRRTITDLDNFVEDFVSVLKLQGGAGGRRVPGIGAGRANE